MEAAGHHLQVVQREHGYLRANLALEAEAEQGLGLAWEVVLELFDR